MLTAVFLNLVYMFVILVDAVSFICSKRSINCIKRLFQSLHKKAFMEPLKIPQHLAIAFGAEELISVVSFKELTSALFKCNSLTRLQFI